MLSREHRLTSSRQFSRAVRTGRRAGSRTLVVHHAAGQATAGTAQVGFVVSKAVGPAVTRNLVKRRLRHLTRTRLDGLPGSDVLVVRALPPAAAAAYGDLGADLDRGLERLGLHRPGADAR